MKKILFVIICMFILTGCTANYNLVISDNSIKETLTINMNSKEYNTFISQNNNKYIKMYYDDPNDRASEGAELPIEGVTYYDFKDNTSSNSVTYTGEFNLKDINRSGIITSGFNSLSVTTYKDEIHLKTSTGFMLLYDGVTNVNISITSPFKVMASNADSVSGNTLVWNIDPSNASNELISVDYSTSDESQTNNETPNEENSNEDIPNDEKIQDVPYEDEESNTKKKINPIVFVIAGSVLLVGIIITIIILKIKKSKINEI